MSRGSELESMGWELVASVYAESKTDAEEEARKVSGVNYKVALEAVRKYHSFWGKLVGGVGTPAWDVYANFAEDERIGQ